MEKGLSYDIEADIEREVDLFSDCAVSDVAKNLIGIFLNTRAAGRLPRIEGLDPAKIKKVAMLGGGVMGSGIVNLLLANGLRPFCGTSTTRPWRKVSEPSGRPSTIPLRKRR